ncbi:MAG TPA: RDD family protein [Rubricoccaceae bacterium]|nr:RDD family protein [Rubricoccaceae bacterium]
MAPYANDPYEPLLPAETAPLADPLKRLGARLLDSLLGVLAVMPGLLLMLSGEDSPLFAVGILAMIAGFFGFIAYQLVLLAREGQTVGKRALGLRIVDYDDESNPGFARVFLARELLVAVIASVPFLGALFVLADVLAIFGEERRCLHDHFARTKVVDETSVAVTAGAGLL